MNRLLQTNDPGRFSLGAIASLSGMWFYSTSQSSFDELLSLEVVKIGASILKNLVNDGKQIKLRNAAKQNIPHN